MSSEQVRRPNSHLDGHYARKQIFCRDWLISWSHRRRFEVALDLAASFGGKCILDYGCGDGTFLAMLVASKSAPAQVLGVEVAPEQILDCRNRLGANPTLRFEHVKALDGDEFKHSFDAAFCTEVLEHVVDRADALDRFDRILKPGGTLVVSVPVEIGLPLLLKQTVRTVAGWRKLGDYAYTEKYTCGELAKSLMPGRVQHIDRPVYGEGSATPYHGHKGFNWRVLEAEIAQRFEIRKRFGSPVSWMGTFFASQIWLIATKRF